MNKCLNQFLEDTYIHEYSKLYIKNKSKTCLNSNTFLYICNSRSIKYKVLYLNPFAIIVYAFYNFIRFEFSAFSIINSLYCHFNCQR